jgi:ketosteroid isomerase-like protein
MANAWIRGTCCFRKTDDVWQCFHEHISFPVDCEKNAIAYDVAAA